VTIEKTCQQSQRDTNRPAQHKAEPNGNQGIGSVPQQSAVHDP
jgi:hypothetical protein